ncbi:oxidative stress defense protein [uncultured Vibrio sp.]|uniref:oxidative stress defense protein n=1 Tax=uncultured Vibrio sp. TaxID=114054 RepID=UPI0009100BDE|nr:oxidative stress defense protein [uncultured Vibrio sp.]OIQ24874.1 MAG: oxidative stress defense protein [Vibrio sp. MedPE-SWchi]
MMKLPIITLALSSLFSLSVWANTPNFPHLVTTGYGEVIATPDMAEFTVKVVESTMNAEQAKQMVDNVVNDFITQLKEEGVTAASINSSNLYLTPQYHYPKKGKPELVGYRASRTVKVKVDDLVNLNQYLDIALSEGINQVDTIRLKVKDEAKYQQQARLAAIKDANAKATSLADGFGQELGSVWRIDYNVPNSRPVLMRSMAMDEKSENIGYQDSTLVIRDRVDVVYRLRN